jgi:CheY-like chemotaxis protein
VALRVLVVDDDQADCELLQRELHKADIQTVIVTDGNEAIDILRDQVFDAVFVDAKMHPADGMEVTRQVRSCGRNKSTPIIMITGNEDPGIAARGFQAGITFFLFKPITQDQLLKLVRVTSGVSFENRRFHRVMVRQEVEVQFNEDSLKGHTIDVSVNGVLVRASRTFPIGSRVSVRLVLSPDKLALAVSGVVMRVPTPESMGIKLDSVGLTERNQLQVFLLPLMIA